MATASPLLGATELELGGAIELLLGATLLELGTVELLLGGGDIALLLGIAELPLFSLLELLLAAMLELDGKSAAAELLDGVSASLLLGMIAELLGCSALELEKGQLLPSIPPSAQTVNLPSKHLCVSI
jgi:hypothetical protein